MTSNYDRLTELKREIETRKALIKTTQDLIEAIFNQNFDTDFSITTLDGNGERVVCQIAKHTSIGDSFKYPPRHDVEIYVKTGRLSKWILLAYNTHDGVRYVAGIDWNRFVLTLQDKLAVVKEWRTERDAEARLLQKQREAASFGIRWGTEKCRY